MKKVNASELIDWWLERYHGTNLAKVKEEHPEWDENPENHVREFYNEYKVTQEQHDEWELAARAYVKNITKVSNKVLERSWWNIYLNTSPSVIKDKI